MTLAEFARQYSNVPFVKRGRTVNGWDCWGLIVNAYKLCYEITLPNFDIDFEKDEAMALETCQTYKQSSWEQVAIGSEREGDIILFRPIHAGIVYDTRKRKFLHTIKNIGTAIESYTGQWQYRLDGFYRLGEP